MNDRLLAARVRLSDQLGQRVAHELVPLAVDSWIVSSLLQKSIRRGDVHTAQRSALTLARLRGSAIWRRLMVIAFEDIGAGSPEAVSATVAAGSDPTWRRAHGGDTVLAVHVVRLLAEAPKDRSADYLICGARNHPDLETVRRECNRSSLRENLENVSKAVLPICTRAAAAWYASGIEWGDEKRVGEGDLPSLMGSFLEMGAPEELVAATETAARRTREPITVMVPLIWLAANDGKKPGIVETSVPPARVVGDVPLYALDMHTRTGREAIHRFAQRNEAVRQCMERYVPKRRWREAAYIAAFYTDAMLLSPRQAWSQSADLEAFGIETDFLNVGVPQEGHAPLLAAFRHHVEELNDQREAVLRAALLSNSGRAPFLEVPA